jgi:transcription-repair coupling factor (superfamily II helicase)
MFQQEISQLNLQQFKAGEKRWIGSLLGSSAALLFKEIATQSSNLYVIVARNNQHLAQLESELEFYGIKPTIFLIGKFCLMTVYLRIKILFLNVWRF